MDSLINGIKKLIKPDEICKICNSDECCTKSFQKNFKNWTSGNDDIDKFIQDTQLLSHRDVNKALEWIPYNKLYDIKHITENSYKANWIDGNIWYWSSIDHDWKRKNQNMIVELKKLNDPKNIALEFKDEIKVNYVFYGITQDPETNDYIMVLNDKCKLCNCICNGITQDPEINDYIMVLNEKCKLCNCICNGITQDPETSDYIMILNEKCNLCNRICNAKHFQQNFNNWTSGNNDIDKFIQYTQLSSHDDADKALEWIPYNKLYNIKYNAEGRCQANWIDGNIWHWDSYDQNWKRQNHNMIVELKKLNDLKNITLEFKDEGKAYGITQDPETKDYIMVLDEECKLCNDICNVKRFQQNFKNWTSGNDDIDKFIRVTQLSSHKYVNKALEWIPYNKLYDIKYNAEGRYKANWIDGNIWRWDSDDQDWKRKHQNMIVELKKLSNPKNIGLEYKVEDKVYGVTQDPESKNYIMVFGRRCKLCNCMCSAIYFEQNFNNWTSGNNDIDKFIQDTQLSAHDVKKALEWIPYNSLYNIEYIAKGGFGKVYRANWIGGYIDKWNKYDKNCERINQDTVVALKSLNNSKNITLEFMNEIMSHKKLNNSHFITKLYGITQDPETKNYMMVLDYAESGSLRDYLKKNYNELNLKTKIDYLCCIAFALEDIHKNELIHRDLHIGNILKNYGYILITDMGLCKPANYNPSENTKNNVYGVLPYIAPEILRGKSYTKAADIYSFGIIMYEVISGLPPYHDLSHDNNLAMKICQGLRPRFNIKIPKSIVYLAKRCLDANSFNRPAAVEIADKLLELSESTELQKQIKETNDNLPSDIHLANSSYKTHPEAIYISRLFDFNDLSEPRNSDDYYEKNDDIISKKFSGN